MTASDHGNRNRILIIEDNLDVADVEMLLCHMDGYEVRSAQTGEDGWAALSEFRPDLVILDLMLPGSLTGNDVLKRIRALGDDASPRVLVVSALVNTETAPNLYRQGRIETLAKPFTLDELSRRIKALFEEGSRA